jgi:hypothetical protein
MEAPQAEKVEVEMGLIEQITQFADHNPRVVISSLVGLIVVGGVGGGIWVKGLQSSNDKLLADLHERENTFQERISLVEQRYKNTMVALWQKDAVISRQLEILQAEIPDLTKSLDYVSLSLKQLRGAELTENQDAALSAAVDSLAIQSASVRTALARIQAAEEMGDELIRLQADSQGPGGVASSAPRPVLGIFILVLTLGGIVLLIVWWSRRRRRARPSPLNGS